MYSPKRLDIGWPDLAAGLLATVTTPSRAADALARRIAAGFPPAAEAFVCLSVRTGFDLYLAALALPPGSEVLLSALTIPDMARLVAHHGLVPVPVDVDPRTLGVCPEALARAITPRSRALVVAHLFGSRMPMEAVVALAARHRLLVIEDCAQGFAAVGGGHPASDVVMWSFGTIKTATALGGAVLRVRDRDVLARMRERHAALPAQTRAAHLRRLLTGAALKALSAWAPYGAFVALCRLSGRDHEAVVHGAARGFPGALLDGIRRRPSAPLLRLLERRLRRFRLARIARRTARAAALARCLPAADQPGRAAPVHTYWAFPVLADDPARVVAALRRAGFDATHRSSLAVVDPPADRPELEPRQARAALARMVFLPVYAELPARAVPRLVRALGVARPPVVRDRSHVRAAST